MKTRLLWALIISAGCMALYCGIARPVVSTTPKRVRDFTEKDPATQPPVKLPPLVVSESRLPAIPLEPVDSPPPSQDGPIQDQVAITKETKIEIKK